MSHLGAYLQALYRHVGTFPLREETNDSAEFMRKLEWELTKIGRDLFDCALLCLTLLFEGEKHGVCRPLMCSPPLTDSLLQLRP